MANRLDLTPDDPETPEAAAARQAFTTPPEATYATQDGSLDGVLDGGPPPAPVTEAEVRSWLTLGGGALNLALPGREWVPDAWRMTDTDLDDAVPPLTRIINRHPRIAALVTRGDADGIALAFAGARYGWRNYTEIRDARADAEPAADDPRLAGLHPEVMA